MEQLEELEAQLVSSDLGTKMTSSLISKLKEDVANGRPVTETGLISVIKEKLKEIFDGGDNQGHISVSELKAKYGAPVVVMIVGVNGVGKTTSAAKLAGKFKAEGHSVMLAAADTFRAAAVEQLVSWGEKIGVPVVSGAADAKPATVAFDAMVEAKNRNADVLIIDTAGRLHTKSNLMQELFGVRNAISRHQENAPHATLLVVDGTSGQNALSQAEQFNAATSLSGIIVTKLDGTAKGGIVAAIKDQMGVPISYIGVGESAEDLRDFDAEEFVDAMLDFTPAEQEEASTAQPSAHAQVRRRRREVGAG